MTTTFDFGGRHVLITGGTSGIGHGVANAFADAGATVTLTGTRATAGAYDVDLARFEYRQLDIRDGHAVDQLARSIEHLDVLVNNAGANFPDGLDESTPDGFEASAALNLFGAYRLSVGCQPALSASDHEGGASVVNLASMSSFRPVPMVPGYGAAKAGIVAMTKHLGLVWATQGVRVNAVAPGLIETGMTSVMKGVPELEGPELAKVPMQRWGEVADVVPAFLFLSSPEARFITGQTLCVDGGYSLS
ncbi:MAG: SDR family NAD(P)-dependent oxidoreductase [Acidimicrobiales bacterium]